MSKNKYDLNALLGDIEKSETKKDEYSSDYWKPTIEKGEERVEYVIRFLENPDSKTNSPWVERAAHMFNFPSKFIYEPCPKKVMKEKCYICEEVSELYNSGDPNKKNIGQKRFSKGRFFHNILIVKDPREGGKNEGKVMIFECGKQVHDKCIEFLKNKDLDPSERVYFHPTMGTNFRLILTWKSDYPNYDKSDFFRKSTPIEINGEELDIDDAEKFIEKNCFKLEEKLLGEKAFKTYDELKELYLNQGVVDEDAKKDNDNDDVDTDAAEEVEETIDETIKEEKVQARNPKKKVKIEKEVEEVDEDDEEVENLVDEDDSNEDEELAALLEDD